MMKVDSYRKVVKVFPRVKSLFCTDLNHENPIRYTDFPRIDNNQISSKDTKVTFVVVDYMLNEHTISAYPGELVYDVAIANNISVKSDCTMKMQCCKCHCILDPEIIEQPDYIRPTISEEDVLYTLVPYTNFSRFSCQTKISPSFESRKVFLVNKEVIDYMNI